jgi:ABC-type dipeptide/oligopeptide/nickel transport system permease component
VLRYTVRRAIEMLLTLLGVSILVFSMIHLIPGDPALLMAGLEASPEVVERTRKELGLDQPLHRQFARFLADVARGDLGISIRTGSPVAEEIADRFPYTLVIALGGMALASLWGTLTGVVAAVHHGRSWDAVVVAASLLAASTPSYWLALMLMLTFSLGLGLLPSIGIATPLHYVLPIVTLGSQSGGLISRVTRAAMLDVLRQDYVGAARARGLGERAVIVRHALHNALIPGLTIMGLRFGELLAGTVLVESVLAIPGLGRLIVDAVLTRDYPLIQGSMLVVTSLFVVVNALTDVVYGVVDPRVRDILASSGA